MDYKLLNEQLIALTSDVSDVISNLANASALIFGALDNVNWAGFYILNGDELLLGPFQGKPACTKIKLGRGVCGTAAENDRVLRVADVHSFAGHIACDGDSRSEIVIPLHKGNAVFGVLDIDSPVLNRFSSEDEEGLKLLAKSIEAIL